MTGADNKLNMSLDDLIKAQRTKGAKPGGAKGKPGQKAGKGVAINKLKGKQQQAAGKKGQPPRAPLKVQKAGVQKATGKAGKAGKADVRVVPRAVPKPAAPFNAAPRMPGFMPQFPMMGMGNFMGGMQQMAQRAMPLGRWQNDRFQGQQQQPQQQQPAPMVTNKLFISNLDFNVSDEDIQELFGTIGKLKESGIHYDKSGRSKGTAHVVFERASDASAAFKKYNGVALDNKRMSIELVDTPVPPGTFKKLSSGIAVSKPAAAAGVRGRGQPQAGGDFMVE